MRTTLEARAEILARLSVAIERASLATACLGEAFELLDDAGAERLEDQLLPARAARLRTGEAGAGHASRTASASSRRRPGAPRPARPRRAPKLLVERAAGAAAEADLVVADLQDSMLPIEAGDAELRAALAEVRELLGAVPAAAREFQRTFGR